MRYSRDDLQQTAGLAMGDRASQQYLKEGTAKLVQFLREKPNAWMHLGPYWGVAKKLLEVYQPSFKQPQNWNGGEPAPIFLAGYDVGDDLLNLVALLTYINRNGDYLADPEQPHSIEMLNGDRALYVPGVGLLEE